MAYSIKTICFCGLISASNKLRFTSTLFKRTLASIGDEKSEGKLRESANKVADELGRKNPEAKKKVNDTLMSRLMSINRESYEEATSTPYSEMISRFATAPTHRRRRPFPAKDKRGNWEEEEEDWANFDEHYINNPEMDPSARINTSAMREIRPTTVSYGFLKRKQTEASRAIREEAFRYLIQRGMSATQAGQKADEIFYRSVDEFDKKINENLRKIKDNKLDEAQKEGETLNREEQIMAKVLEKLEDFSTNMHVEENQSRAKNSKEVVFKKRKCIEPTPFPQLFDYADNKPIFTNKNLRRHVLEFWQEWDRRKAEVENQGIGPRNAFEEQIEWTKNGRMWPYPIDNEYLFGLEHKTSFMDHVFLEPYWRKHQVPHSKYVEHFMELVLTGLSKNPYMSVAKKRDHIDWFADYFKEQLSPEGKYKSIL